MALNAPSNPRDRAVRGRIGRKQPSRQQTHGWLFYRGHGKKMGLEDRDMQYSPGKRFYVHESGGTNPYFYITYGKNGEPLGPGSGFKFQNAAQAMFYVRDQFSVDPVVLASAYPAAYPFRASGRR